jgi:DNA-binding IclR family transcriptional regulator
MKTTKSVLRALDILELVSGSQKSLTLSQIAYISGINRTTVFRFVQTLGSRGYLMKNNDRNEYQIGLKILPMAAKLLDSNRLRVESLPYIEELATKCGERINLGILYEGEVLYLGGVDKPSLPMKYSLFGKTPPAHCCSLGKVMLAHMPKEEVEAILDRKPLIKLTENTITDRKLLYQHLAEIRSQGYATDNQETLPGVYCMGALVRDSEGRGIGAISITSNSNLEKIKEKLDDLLQTAEIISHAMGTPVL